MGDAAPSRTWLNSRSSPEEFGGTSALDQKSLESTPSSPVRCREGLSKIPTNVSTVIFKSEPNSLYKMKPKRYDKEHVAQKGGDVTDRLPKRECAQYGVDNTDNQR